MSTLAEQLTQRKGHYSLPDTSDRVASSEPGICPTPEGITKLCEPIVRMLHSITTYDVIGNSTHVVVVDVQAPLTVAFVAAHETRASSCVLWDSRRHCFEGLITIKDYIKVLLHCQQFPQEAETIQNMSVFDWRERMRASAPTPPMMASASVDDALGVCLEKMQRHRVHRLPILAERDELGSFSIVSVLGLPQLNHYMCRALFSDGTEGEGALLLPATAQQILLGSSPDSSSPTTDQFGGTPVVGTYCSIFDVPLSCLPSLGVNRHAPCCVRMESTVEEALRMLVDRHVQAVAVVDDFGIVIDVISRSDVMRLERNGFYDLMQTVRDALSFRVGGTIFAIRETATVREIVLHFHRGGVKELFIVDPSTDAVVGQLGLAEVLYFLYGGHIVSNTT